MHAFHIAFESTLIEKRYFRKAMVETEKSEPEASLGKQKDGRLEPNDGRLDGVREDTGQDSSKSISADSETGKGISNDASADSDVGNCASPRSPVHFPGDVDDDDEYTVTFVPVLPRSDSGQDVSEKKEALSAEGVFNPFELITQKSQKFRTDALCDALTTSAVELGVELREISRMEFFQRNNMFVSVRVPGMQAGSWEELDCTECVSDSRSPHFVRKIRLPASTSYDREMEYRLHVYNTPVAVPQDGDVEVELIGETSFTIASLLEAKQMSNEKAVVSPRSGRAKGRIVLSLDMIQHEEKVEKTVFDFGFTEDAPVRNRIFYVISRAIQKGRFTPVYRSEIQTKEKLSKFEDVTLSSQELHGGDSSRLFRIEVYRYYKNGKTTLLGFVQTSLDKIKTCEPGAQLYWWPAISGFARISFKIVSTKMDAAEGRNWFVLRMCA